MSSASVDFKFAIDTHKTGSGADDDAANWPTHGRLCFTFGSGDSGGSPPAPYHTPIFCYTTEPSPWVVMRDYNNVIAAWDPSWSGMEAAIVAAFGQSVYDELEAICIDTNLSAPYLTDAGWAMYHGIRIRKEAQEALGKVTPW